ncbi:MAG: DsrE family protein [Halieaceae bacterium]|jgi:intracellular sulfur oxidation DsrE/DsrF family protein|nr:DsrE family protein [Halieaceae bacterium]
MAKILIRRALLAAAIVAATAASLGAQAGREDFHPGELIPEYGRIAAVPGAPPLPADTRFKLAIDVVDGGETGRLNSKFVTAASFLNLQHANGIPAENVEIALVVHGPAHRDLLTDEAYGGDNPNAELLAALQKYQVRVLYCGQSAVANDIAAHDLLPGVEFGLSATTTHVLLQQQGYALRP